MSTRKPTTPPAGPTCPGCQRQAADLARLQSQQRKQAAELRQLQTQLRAQAAELAEERERGRRLAALLEWQQFTQPYLLHQFTQHLPEGSTLVAGLTHFN